ncbi:aminoglycoside adenylyltransferase domain-containing protein [Paenibacillus montanisoli]|uniref:Spectinomycin 9-adenylyltransferase n=1 Tax=Paenibacillus montanisoli TaxID=2081970 RepID=A0A328U574_9BACL|nr:aminoglycoside adenylyltransferase domain-containing protein [Paenibacillus montanisoli]RAP77998.1 hypothetical protein DL346_05985 [Paenibacillus montanisoli]
MNAQDILNQLVDLFKEELDRSLVGIYLHGSLAMGCYNQEKSDIDLLIVAQHKLTAETSKRIARKLVAVRERMDGASGFEISVLVEQDLIDFKHPTPFELHYSDGHHAKYSADENYLCGGFDDPDLAAHIVVTYRRGITLCGKPIRDIFPEIDKKHYVHSIVSDVEYAPSEIHSAPVYYTLNLCRVLYFLKEGVVSSKKEGGEWGVRVLPVEYRDVAQYGLNAYIGSPDKQIPNDEQLTRFAGYMIDRIKEAINPTIF